jgi:hypothetical protein
LVSHPVVIRPFCRDESSSYGFPAAFVLIDIAIRTIIRQDDHREGMPRAAETPDGTVCTSEAIDGEITSPAQLSGNRRRNNERN